jgi:hypothetical protein
MNHTVRVRGGQAVSMNLQEQHDNGTCCVCVSCWCWLDAVLGVTDSAEMAEIPLGLWLFTLYS